jgi:tetrahydromethanopterin S-methyltransferase subunit F
MLASLLPGLRDVRTPLATGYIYAAFGWIAWGSLLPGSTDDASGLLQRIYTLASTLGPPTMLAIGSFAAFLVGSVLTIDLRNDLAIGILRTLRAIPRADIYDVRNAQYIRERLREIEREIDRTVDDERLTGEESRALMRLHRGSATAGTVGDAVTRLMVTSQPLYGEYDRLQAEATFRVNVAIPLVLVTIAVSAQADTPLRIAGLAVGIALAVVLLRQGGRRFADANAVVTRAILAEVISNPEVESARATLEAIRSEKTEILRSKLG